MAILLIVLALMLDATGGEILSGFVLPPTNAVILIQLNTSLSRPQSTGTLPVAYTDSPACNDYTAAGCGDASLSVVYTPAVSPPAGLPTEDITITEKNSTTLTIGFTSSTSFFAIQAGPPLVVSVTYTVTSLAALLNANFTLFWGTDQQISWTPGVGVHQTFTWTLSAPNQASTTGLILTSNTVTQVANFVVYQLPLLNLSSPLFQNLLPIFTCYPSSSTSSYLTALQTLQQQAFNYNSVIIQFPNGTFIYSTPNTYPILNLQQGLSISGPNSNNPSVDINTITDAWNGDLILLTHLTVTCLPLPLRNLSIEIINAACNINGIKIAPGVCTSSYYQQNGVAPVAVYLGNIAVPALPTLSPVYPILNISNPVSCPLNTSSNYNQLIQFLYTQSFYYNSVIIQFNDGSYIYSQPNTYPILNLRSNHSISGPLVGAQAIVSNDIISSTWVGSVDQLTHLTATCLAVPVPLLSIEIIDASCNLRGIKISSTICGGDYSNRTLNRPLIIYLANVATVSIPFTPPSNFLNYTQIFTCPVDTAAVAYIATIVTLQNQSLFYNSVVIQYPDGRFIYSRPNTYPIFNLRAGLSISGPFGTGSIVSTQTITDTWVGPNDLLTHFPGTCITVNNLSIDIIGASCNPNAIKIGPNICRGDWTTGLSPLVVYLANVATPVLSNLTATPGSNLTAFTSILPILSCPSVISVNYLPAIQFLHAQSFLYNSVVIQYPDGSYVYSKAGSYPILNLRANFSISGPQNGTGTVTASVIAATWIASSPSLLTHFSATCLSVPLTPLSTEIINAACNLRGVVVSSTVCGGDYSNRTATSPLTLYLANV